MTLLPFLAKEPWAHQRACVERALSMRDYALFLGVGTGKTYTTINILRHRYAESRRVMRTLILCPVVVCENWRREFAQFSKVGHQVVVLSGSQKNRKIQLAKGQAQNSNIFVTNYEALQMKELVQEILRWEPEIFVADESQRLKNPDAIRTKMSVILARRTAHNYILSGTPIINSPLDIFSQYLVLDRGATFGEKYYAFRARYFEDQNAGMPAAKHFAKWAIREEVLDVMNEKIYAKATRVQKEECLDLPDLVREEYEVQLGTEQKRIYQEMKNQFVAFLDAQGEGQIMSAQVAITKALRLQQVVTGYVKPDGGEEVSLKSNPRLDALEELLEDITPGQKVIVWACFQENYAQVRKVCERLKIPYTELTGQVAGKDRQANIDRFQNDDDCRVIIANQKAAGLGVTLTAASVAIYYSKGFGLEDDLQSEARCHRGGSEIHNKVTRIDLVARGTIDEIITRALASKLDLAEKILELRNRL